MPADLRDTFLDTNILVYAFSTDARSKRAEELMASGFSVGVQTLNEFANVARRKLAMSWEQTNESINIIRQLARVIVPLDLEIHEQGLAFAGRYQLSVFDGTMLAAAIAVKCKFFCSEDLQHGMIIEDSLQVANPFV